jgi:16S rRNA (guanine966-N2)-methyltransferase
MHSSKGARAKAAPAGRVRIIGGAWRGRRLEVAARAGLRPTPDRVRETLFNWLGQRLDGLACLDLYAGSGALGFEAASRGAARVVLVECDRAALAALERSRDSLGAVAVRIEKTQAADYLARAGERFDVVFVDPPFGQNAVPAILPLVAPRLAAGARVYVESRAGELRPFQPPPWRELRRAQAGQVSFRLLQWNANGERR